MFKRLILIFGIMVTLFTASVTATESCGECDGKISNFTLQYNGNEEALVEVYGFKDVKIFSQTLSKYDFFALQGYDKKDTLGPKIELYVNGTLDTEIHTSCSIPILLGMEFGSFTIRDGASRNGGQTCSVDGYIPVGHLCGTVYEDANANGLFDSTETSQAAIGVNIVDIFGVSTRLNTDVDGSYCNYNVAQGNASVTVDETTLPEGTSLINGENPNSVSVIANTVNDAGLDGYMFAPTANDQNITLNANTQKSITLSGVDKSNRSLSYIILTQPLHGALSGVAPNMVYTPYTDYEGTDSFTFKVNNGVLDSDPATVNLTVIEPNYPPEIISTPLQKIDENSLYTYDVNALDPNKKDVLTYSTLKAPSGLNIDNTTGLITWEANALYAQSVPTFNKQCYTIPTEAEPISSSGGDTSYIVPIFQDVKTAISKGSDYIAPQTVAWDKRNGCLGCHVQTQTLVGLQASAAKADVDEAAGEYLLAKILRSQQSDGSIRNSYPGFSRTQTAFGLWSLSYVPDSDRTFNVRANALRFFYNTKYSSGSTTRWSIDHQTGWLRTTDAITATVLFGASRYLTDYKKQTNPTAIETDMANKYTNELPRMVQYLLSRSNATPYNYINALHMVGMAEAKIHITDETLLASINAKIETLETLFRSRQNSDGGWSYYNTGVSDPMTSAWVGLALNYQNPPLTDDAVLRNIKYLLNAQRSDGTWKGSLFSTYLGTTSLVMAYLPVALEFLGNPDMSASNVVLDDKAMTLSAQITNRGLGDVTVPLEVRFFNGSPDANDLLGVTTLQGLPSDAQQNVNISLDRLPNEDVFVVLSATAATPECELGNNVVRTAFVQVDAADPEGLFDQQSFLINVLDVNEAPVIISEALPNLPIGLSYNYQIEITDKDVGDAHIFALEQAPQGLFIDAHSGKIQYDLEQIVAGSYEVIVKVTDLQGLSSAKTFTLIVEANTHPFITSTPGTEVRVAQTYQYAVVANDNDGDQLEYTLETSPLTMDINTSSGLITWTPLPIHEGLHLVKIVVKDGRGGISTQSFSLYVIANNPPIITSTPLFEGVVDHLYRYQVVASDPDLDALSYTLLQSPIGMHIDEQGEITFTPQYGDRGMHAVVVEVKDAYESGVQQSYMLNISLAQNLPPVITILGDNPLVLLQGSTFVDPGAVAVDDVDGNISVHASHQINTNILGQYLVTYTATDSQQNMATTYRAVYIVDSNYAQPDITPPSITVLGDNPHRLTIGDSYTDAGATAWDNRDGSVSVGVSYSFNTSVEGTYQVTYTAVDSAGNSAKAYRSVMVVDINTPDTTPPVMVILGDNPLTILQGESYNDPGANVVDDHDGQIGYSLRHNVNSTQVGTYTVIYSAIDIAGNSAEATRTVYVKDPNGNRAPIADAGGDLVVALEQNVTLDGSLSQDLDGEIIAYEWSENSTILSTDVAFTKVGLSRGIHEITLKVTDNEGAFSTDTVIVRLIDENDTTAPTALITSPTEDTIVKLQAEIVGTAYDENLAYYELFFSPVGKNTYNLFADGNASVTDGVLGTFNGSTINNGIYDIMLRVVDLNGEVTNAYTRVIVKGKAKIGNFSFTVTDFDINVAGIPVKVNRTYSTLQRFEKLDFGYAWSVDYQNVKIEENIHPGEEWRMDPDLFAIGYCFKPKKQHIVNISLPDGTTESFELKFEIECAHYFPNNPYDAPKYYALNGSEAKLEPIGTSDATSMDNYGRLLDWLTLDIYNPSKYRLSLSNGMVYELDQEFGIERVIDNRGDTLTYNNNGIVSSRGVALTFERDDQNRITRITDLADKNVTYHYDGNDDLDYIIDQMGYTTTYKYQAGHLMEEYFDPSGTRITKNIYDDAGRLIKMIDPDGNVVEFTHNIDGNEEIIYDKLGRVSVFVYDDEGNVLGQTNPLGETTTYSYDAKGNVLSTTDALGNTVSNTYDNSGNLLSTIDALGNTEENSYNAKGSPTTISDKNGNTMSIVYDSYNAPTSMTTASGATTTFSYDAYGDKATSTNEYGKTTTYEYEAGVVTLLGKMTSTGRIIKEVDPSGVMTRHTYDGSGNALTTTRTYTKADGTVVNNLTTNTYDAYDRVVSTTDESGNTTSYAYDARGNKVSTTDAQNRVTTYEYAPSNKLTKTTYPDGTTESKTYDAMGNLLSETDTEGQITSYEYDAADRLVKTIYSDNSFTTTTYDEAGRTTSSTDANGNKTSYVYDEVGNRVSVTDALNNTTTFSYDAQGNMLSTTNALGQTTSYEYNALNQRVKTTYPDGTTTLESKNISGLPSSKTDENGITTTYSYDTSRTMPLLQSVTLANGAITNYSYNKLGAKTAQIDALSHTTSYSYNDLGQLESETLPLGQSKTFTYDQYGKQTQVSDYANKTTRFIYDSHDKLVRTEYTDGTSVTYAYTPAGQLKTVTDAQGTITKAYDSRGRLKTETKPGSESIAYAYDGVGNITEVRTANTTVTKTYDALNRLNSVTDATGTTAYSYDALGRQTRVDYPNGVSTNYTYDSRSRVVKMEHKDSADTLLQSFSYTRDNVGNKLRVVENSGRTVAYTYDSLNRLTGETVTNDPEGKNTVTTYSYDNVGNLVAKIVDNVTTDYTYNANDQLASQGTSTFTYDDNGNLLQKDGTAYTYDDKNRLIEVSTPGGLIEYAYDANNNRIAKRVNGEQTSYLVDGNTAYAQVIEERTPTGTRNYTYGNDLITDGSSYFLTDALGSTRGLTDANQTLTDSYSYTPYGELNSHTGTSDNTFLYTGEQFDNETDNYYLRARYYDPGASRFISKDTYDGRAGEPITLNHYAYANSNPMMYTDPSGYMSMVEVTMSTSIMNELRTINPAAAFVVRRLMKDVSCLVVKEGIDYTIKEGIYMWITNDGKVYVGKSNDDIEKRIKDHVKKKGKIFNKQLARINLSLPPKLLETIEQVIMEEMGFESRNNPGSSANARNNFAPPNPDRRKAYRRYKRLLQKLCK